MLGSSFVWGIRFQLLFPSELFWSFVSSSVTVYCIIGLSGCLCRQLVRGKKKPKLINLMDCICLAQQAQFSWPGTIIDLEKLKRDKDNNYVMMTLCHKTVDS